MKKNPQNLSIEPHVNITIGVDLLTTSVNYTIQLVYTSMTVRIDGFMDTGLFGVAFRAGHDLLIVYKGCPSPTHLAWRLFMTVVSPRLIRGADLWQQ